MLPAVLLGVLLPLVLRMNATLGQAAGQLQGSILVHTLGALFGCTCLLPFLGTGWITSLGSVPWWGFGGGIMGVGMVVLATRAIGVLGVAGFTVVSVAFQLITSAILDHYGLMGAQVIPMSATRILGLALLLAGAALVVKGGP